MRISRGDRSKVIRDLLISRDPEAIELLHFEAKLSILDDKLKWTNTLLALARELEAVEEDEGTLDSARAVRMHALALKACLLRQEKPCEATNQAFARALSLYADLIGKKVEVKHIEKELAGLFKRPKGKVAPQRKRES